MRAVRRAGAGSGSIARPPDTSFPVPCRCHAHQPLKNQEGRRRSSMAKKAKKKGKASKAKAPARKKAKGASRAKAGAPKAKKPSWRPAGFTSVTPHLVCAGAADAINFYKNAFGAKENARMPGPDGQKIMHAEISIGDAV